MKSLVSILIIFPFFTFAQNKSIEIKGVALSETTHEPIPYVFIKNISNSKIASANQYGNFNIGAEIGDTITFTHISTFDKKYIVFSLDSITIYLTDNIQELDEVATLPSYKNFQKQLLALRIEDTKPKIHIPGVVIRTKPGIPPPPTAKNPLSFIASKLSKKEKEKTEYRRVLLEQKEVKQYHERLTPEFVREITKLEGDKLEAFMKHCKFDKFFVLNATDYELTVAVQTCYEEFKGLG